MQICHHAAVSFERSLFWYYSTCSIQQSWLLGPILLRLNSSRGSAHCPMRSFGSQRIMTFISLPLALAHGNAPTALARDQVPPPRSVAPTLPPPTTAACYIASLLREDDDNVLQQPEIPLQLNADHMSRKLDHKTAFSGSACCSLTARRTDGATAQSSFELFSDQRGGCQ